LTLLLSAAAFGQDLTAVQRLYDEGRFVEAWQMARKTAAAQPSAAAAQYWAGMTALRCGALDEADKAFDRALRIQPKYAGAAMGRGQIQESREQWAKAIDWYEKALQMDPHAADAPLRIARIYRDNGAWSRASEYFRKAQAAGGGDPALAAELGATQKAEAEQRSGIVSAETFRSLRPPAPVKAVAPDPARLAFKISFPRNKFAVADLPAVDRAQLDQVAAALLSPEWKSRRPLVVEGNTCSCGSDAFNLDLGRKRAQSVREYLIAKKALTEADSQVDSKGKSNPVVVSSRPELSFEECQRDETHNLNRRVVIKEARSGSSAQVSFWYRPAAGGEFRPLTNGATLHTNDQIKVKVESFTPIYAYVLHHGSAGDWAALFPNGKITPGAHAINPVAEGDPVWIPGSGDGLKLDETPGPEETMVYISPGPDPGLEKLVADLRTGVQPKTLPGTRVARVEPGAGSVKPPKPPVGKAASSVPPRPAAEPDSGDLDIFNRGLNGVTASKPGNLMIDLRSFASVKFDHRP
jgi:outer membrane protein OmpA-like peptidoglycan-associated protein